jgi:hypothetical protein
MERDPRSLHLLTAVGGTESGYDVTFAGPLAVSHLELTRKSISHRRLHFSRFLLRLQGHGLQSLGLPQASAALPGMSPPLAEFRSVEQQDLREE